MQYAFQVIEGEPAAMLPTLVTAGDVREVVQLLRKKPEGIAIVEASAAIRKRLFDPRKVAAYELWGVISKDNDRIKLSRLGHEFADRLGPEAQIYRVMLNATPPYQGALDWIHRQNLDLVTHADIGEYWQNNFPESLPRGERTYKGQAISFFQLCHAAEIGIATVGRKLQPSRLLIDRSELRAYLEGGQAKALERALTDDQIDARQPVAFDTTPAHRQRVFISTPKKSGMVSSIQDALQLAEIESEVVEREASSDELVSVRALRAIRRCNAGIIVLRRADCHQDEAGKEALDQGVLIEIGAAFVHFARRVVLLHSKQIPLPSNLDGLCRYELEGSELTWETGLRLIKTIKLFQTDS